MRRAFQSAVFFLCVLFSVAGAYNVLSDNADVERIAKDVACKVEPVKAPSRTASAPDACRAQKTSMERTPIAQTFEFAVGSKQVTVRCTRSAILLGEYGCELR